MKITKNKKLDVGYIEFRKGSVSKTIEVFPDILFDLDKGGQLLGIEVLSLSTSAPKLRLVRKALRPSRVA